MLGHISKLPNPWNVIRYLQKDDFQEQKTRYRNPSIENTLEEAIKLIKNSKRIIILTGAGVSVSCGIPDFRSAGGVYDQIEEKYGLSDPQLLFDKSHLLCNPQPFFEFAKEIYPGNYNPSLAHHFISKIEKEGKLLRNYTQNIDCMEELAGIKRVINCHGNFSTATCITCKKTVAGSEIKDQVMKSQVPYCDRCCDSISFFKPNIVFFGEDLPKKFYSKIKKDQGKADLLIVMGSSLRVEPVANIPEQLKEIPQILINRELVSDNHEFDITLLGDADEIVREICSLLGWRDVSINRPASNIDLSLTSSHIDDHKYEFLNDDLLFDNSFSLFDENLLHTNSCSSFDFFDY
jgi:NAD+-dependent protein deacetylase sirtuin 1